MAKKVEVVFNEGDEWMEIDVANFYDPEVHNTVRRPGSAKKESYVAMRFPDGRVYDKVHEKWMRIEPSLETLIFTDPPTIPLNFKDQSVSKIVLSNVLQYVDSPTEYIKEVARGLIPGGYLEIVVPRSPSVKSFSDPDAKRYFSEFAFNVYMDRYSLFLRLNVHVNNDEIYVKLRK